MVEPLLRLLLLLPLPPPPHPPLRPHPEVSPQLVMARHTHLALTLSTRLICASISTTRS